MKKIYLNVALWFAVHDLRSVREQILCARSYNMRQSLEDREERLVEKINRLNDRL